MLMLVLAAQLLAPTGASGRSLESGRVEFERYVDEAKKKLGIDEFIEYDEVEPGEPKMKRRFAVAAVAKIESPQAAWHPLYVRTPFLVEAPSAVLKHVAYHEMCHILRRDTEYLASRLQEIDTEHCVLAALGEKEFSIGLVALRHWKPVDLETPRGGYWRY